MNALKKREELITRKFKWMHTELRERRGLTHAHGNSTLAGCRIIEAHFCETPCPIGTLWYRHIHKDVIDILSIYVIDYARRCGVASFLLEKLVESFPETKQVISGDGTVYGKAWMRANGFYQSAASEEWVKRCSKKSPK